MQEAAKFDDVDLVWNVTAVASESVGAASGTHVNYIGLDEAFLIRMNWDQVFGSALLKLSEEFSLEPYKLGSNLFKLHGNLFAGEVLQQWLDIDELQRERNKLRVLSNYLKEFSDSEFSSNVFSSDVNDCALHFVTGSVPEQELTQHFLELDEDVFRQDNWATCPQITNCDVSAVPICGPLTWTRCRCAEQIRTFLHDFISKVDILCKQIERLCRLALTLICFAYKGSSTFLTQKRWFLHHTAHPPRQWTQSVLVSGS